jgi:antitoxin (DNA-binding transcriptional repressor) of toxin-antitoxin stability system
MSSVETAQLKAHLSAYLRAVEGGEVVTVYDRERLCDFLPPPPVNAELDIVAVLIDERARDRGFTTVG